MQKNKTCPFPLQTSNSQRRTSEHKSTMTTARNISAWRSAGPYSIRITAPMLLTNGFVKQILIHHVLFISACCHVGNSISFRSAEYTFICQFNLTLFRFDSYLQNILMPLCLHCQYKLCCLRAIQLWF
jgi:hypothetical protein